MFVAEVVQAWRSFFDRHVLIWLLLILSPSYFPCTKSERENSPERKSFHHRPWHLEKHWGSLPLLFADSSVSDVVRQCQPHCMVDVLFLCIGHSSLLVFNWEQSSYHLKMQVQIRSCCGQTGAPQNEQNVKWQDWWLIFSQRRNCKRWWAYMCGIHRSKDGWSSPTRLLRDLLDSAKKQIILEIWGSSYSSFSRIYRITSGKTSRFTCFATCPMVCC